MWLDKPLNLKDSNKIINERGEIATDITEIQRLIRDYLKQLYINKLYSLA